MSKIFIAKFLPVLMLSLVLKGCLYPEKPSQSVVSKTIPIETMSAEWNTMAMSVREIGPPGKSHRLVRQRNKNLLFVAADEVIGQKLKPELTQIYKKEVRLDEILWAYYAPKIQKVYDNVLRIRWDGLSAESLDAALTEMEALKVPYDVMILAHGIPNHMISSPGKGVIGYDQLALFKGLAFADTLYLQACFGDTLAQDFLDMGFKKVIAARGFSINFFYPDFYLESLSRYRGDTQKAHERVLKTFDRRFKMNIVQKEAVKVLFKDDPMIRGNPDRYLEHLENPEIYYQ